VNGKSLIRIKHEPFYEITGNFLEPHKRFREKSGIDSVFGEEIAEGATRRLGNPASRRELLRTTERLILPTA